MTTRGHARCAIAGLACGMMWVLACSSSSESTPSEEESTSGTEAPAREDPPQVEVMILGCLDDDCGHAGSGRDAGETQAPQPPEAPPRRPLASETLPMNTQFPAGLVSVSEPLARIQALPTSLDQPAETMHALVADLVQRTTRAAHDIRRIDDACVSVDPALMPECTTLRADARDLLAGWLAGVSIAVPREMEVQLARVDETNREYLRQMVLGRIHEELARQAEPLWCQAAPLYANGNTTRAREQLDRYGDFFIAGCP